MTVRILRTLVLKLTEVRDSQEDPRLSGSSRHLRSTVMILQTLRRIPDCPDPLNTRSYAHSCKGLSGGSRTVRILQTLTRIPDCPDPLNTRLYANSYEGLSGESRTVRILQTPQEDPGLSGSSGHLFICPLMLGTLKRIPDCPDPLNTRLYANSYEGLSGSSGHLFICPLM